MSKIDYGFLKGGIVKEVVKSLLQRYGYEVYPYGYETNFSVLKNKLAEEGVRTSPSRALYDLFLWLHLMHPLHNGT